MYRTGGKSCRCCRPQPRSRGGRVSTWLHTSRPNATSLRSVEHSTRVRLATGRWRLPNTTDRRHFRQGAALRSRCRALRLGSPPTEGRRGSDGAGGAESVNITVILSQNDFFGITAQRGGHALHGVKADAIRVAARRASEQSARSSASQQNAQAPLTKSPTPSACCSAHRAPAP